MIFYLFLENKIYLSYHIFLEIDEKDIHHHFIKLIIEIQHTLKVKEAKFKEKKLADINLLHRFGRRK